MLENVKKYRDAIQELIDGESKRKALLPMLRRQTASIAICATKFDFDEVKIYIYGKGEYIGKAVFYLDGRGMGDYLVSVSGEVEEVK